MAIAVRCISCGKVANVRNELGGKKAKCTCGAIIAVPLPAKPKTCSNCGVDLTHAKRTKDAQGNLLCHVCLDAKLEAAKVGVAASEVEDVLYYPCEVCSLLCTADEVYDAGGEKMVCKKCWNAGKRPGGAVAAAG